MNIAVVTPGAGGSLAIFPGGAPTGASTAISYKAGRTRANNFIARLGTNGDIVVICQQTVGTTHFIIDVSGYFEDPPATPASTLAAFANITTFGSTPGLVGHLRDVGTNAFLAEQFAAPPSFYPGMALFPNKQQAGCTGNCPRDNYTMYPLQKQFFINALYGQDQLRQRVAWALHKIIPINGQDIGQPSRMAPYLNIFIEQRVRELPGHPLPDDAEPGDGPVPEHEHVHAANSRTRTTRGRSCSSSRSAS